MKKLLIASAMLFGMVGFASAQTGKKASVKKGKELKVALNAGGSGTTSGTLTPAQQKAVDEKRIQDKNTADANVKPSQLSRSQGMLLKKKGN